jgi:PAS domain S-box-containing protein
VRDITAQKMAAKVIIESEEKFRTLAENAAAVCFILRKGKYNYVNPTWCQITGYTANELLFTIPEEVLTPDQLAENRQEASGKNKPVSTPERIERTITTRNEREAHH